MNGRRLLFIGIAALPPLLAVSFLACNESAPSLLAPQPAGTPPSEPIALVVSRQADPMGNNVFRYRLKVRTEDDTYLLTCSEDENNVVKRDCNWQFNANLSHIDRWRINDPCESSIYDPIIGKSKIPPKCVYIVLWTSATVWEVTKDNLD
jgi:hypothetical protein